MRLEFGLGDFANVRGHKIERLDSPMARKLMEQLTIVSAASAVLTPFVKGSDIRFTAEVGSDTVCDTSGRPRVFKNADDFFQAVVKRNPYATQLTTVSDITGLVTPKVPSDPLAAAEAKLASATKSKATAVARLADLNTKLARIASWENSPLPEEAAQFVEFTAQAAAVSSQVDFYQGLIDAANAIISP